MEAERDRIDTSEHCEGVVMVEYFDEDGETPMPCVLTARTPRGFTRLIHNSQLNFVDLSAIAYVERNWTRRML